MIRSEYSANQALQQGNNNQQQPSNWEQPARNASRFARKNWFVRIINAINAITRKGK